MTAPPRAAPLAAPRPQPQPPPPVTPAPAPQSEVVMPLAVAPQKRQLIVPRSVPAPAAPVAFQPAPAQPAAASHKALLITLIVLSTLTVTGIGVLVGIYLARKPPPVIVASAPPVAQPPPAVPAALPPAKQPASAAKVAALVPSTVVLLAREAKLHGIALDKEKAVIQGWDKPGDHAEWRVAIRAPGRYDVKMDYAKYGGAADLILVCAGQKMQAKLGSTGAWTSFKETNLGSVRIAKAGDCTVLVKSANPKAALKINLRALTLAPAAP